MIPDSEDNYEYPETPELLKLEDNEKFKDDDENIIEIETRGQRTPKGIYFLAKDVSKAFNMNNLNSILLHVEKGYIKDIHYKTFINDNTQKTKKQLYLTYLGFLKVIFGSRNYNTKLNQLVLMNWVQYNADVCKLSYKPKLINIDDNIGLSGVVYFITCDILNGVKIGFWRSNMNALKARYTTPYGKNCKIIFYKTDNAPELEKDIHYRFSEYRVTNEIFKKENFDDYLNFMKNIKQLEMIDYDNYYDDYEKEINLKPSPMYEYIDSDDSYEIIKSKNETIKSKNEIIKSKNEIIKSKDELLKSKDELLKSKDRIINMMKEEILKKINSMDELLKT